MDPVLRALVLALAALVVGLVVGWAGRGARDRRRLRRKQRFLGLPQHSECLLVVGRDPATGEGSVPRDDVLALLELAAVVRECGAHPQLTSGETVRQGFGERTEFCVGGPVTNRRLAAHLRSLLPGVQVNTSPDAGPDRGAFTIGGERYRQQDGAEEHVLLARLTAGEEGRPVFLACGQRPVTTPAATRYLARHHARLARRYGVDGTFCLLLRVVNSQAYGPDVVELVADVTRAATTDPASGADTGKGRRRGA